MIEPGLLLDWDRLWLIHQLCQLQPKARQRSDGRDPDMRQQRALRKLCSIRCIRRGRLSTAVARRRRSVCRLPLN